MQSNKYCDRLGCSKEATHQVRLVLRATPGDDPKAEAVSTPFMYLCADHSAITIRDIYTAEGWRQIERAFTLSGKAKPVLAYSRIKIETKGGAKEEGEGENGA